MALPARVLDTIRRRALLRRGDRVLVALSGGPDSVALLRLLGELEAGGELTVVGVAHLNHGLREAANDDEQFCRALASEVGVPFRSDLVDVRARAARLGTSLEDAGRQARYELFERVATELGADVVATGHTRDDQAETFLLRLLRGAGRADGGPAARRCSPCAAGATWACPPCAEGAKVGRPPGPRLWPRRAARLSGVARSALPRGREQPRPEHSAEPGPARAAAAAGA